MPRDERWWSWLDSLAWCAAASATILLAIALLKQQASLHATEKMLSIADEQTFQNNLRSRLLGEPFPSITLRSLTGTPQQPSEAIDGVSVVWVVDAAACPACAKEAQNLNRANLPDYPPVLVIFSGVGPAAAVQRADDWGLRTPALTDESELVRGSLGLPFESSFLVLNEHGIILHGEFHRGVEACRIDVMELARRLTAGERLRSLLVTPTPREEDS